jgi:hypothetical protein
LHYITYPFPVLILHYQNLHHSGITTASNQTPLTLSQTNIHTMPDAPTMVNYETYGVD